MPLRILYAAGNGDAVKSFRNWRRGALTPTEVSITYSGQFFDFCRGRGARADVLSTNAAGGEEAAEGIRVRNRLKPLHRWGRGAGFYMVQGLSALRILWLAARLRADAAVVTNDSTFPFLHTPLRWMGVRTVMVLHNSLWPNGYEACGRATAILRRLDGWFWRHGAHATICVSPECARQVRRLAGSPRGPVVEMRAMFDRRFHEGIRPPLRREGEPFAVLYAGRIEVEKGVLDLLDVAATLHGEAPGRYRFTLCGDGSALARVREEIARRGLGDVVAAPGHLPREGMLEAYGSCHAVVVPTRSTFCEGLCKAAVEGVLAGRPVVTSRLSNGLDVLAGAIVEAQPDDPPSFARAIRHLASDPAAYAAAVAQCPRLAAQFFDRANGFEAALAQVLGGAAGPGATRRTGAAEVASGRVEGAGAAR